MPGRREKRKKEKRRGRERGSTPEVAVPPPVKRDRGKSDLRCKRSFGDWRRKKKEKGGDSGCSGLNISFFPLFFSRMTEGQRKKGNLSTGRQNPTSPPQQAAVFLGGEKGKKRGEGKDTAFQRKSCLPLAVTIKITSDKTGGKERSAKRSADPNCAPKEEKGERGGKKGGGEVVSQGPRRTRSPNLGEREREEGGNTTRFILAEKKACSFSVFSAVGSRWKGGGKKKRKGGTASPCGNASGCVSRRGEKRRGKKKKRGAKRVASSRVEKAFGVVFALQPQKAQTSGKKKGHWGGKEKKGKEICRAAAYAIASKQSCRSRNFPAFWPRSEGTRQKGGRHDGTIFAIQIPGSSRE